VKLSTSWHTSQKCECVWSLLFHQISKRTVHHVYVSLHLFLLILDWQHFVQRTIMMEEKIHNHFQNTT